MKSMKRDNNRLSSCKNEPVKFEKRRVKTSRLWGKKFTDHLRGIYGVTHKSTKKILRDQNMYSNWTWKCLDLDQLRPKVSPGTVSLNWEYSLYSSKTIGRFPNKGLKLTSTRLFLKVNHFISMYP